MEVHHGPVVPGSSTDSRSAPEAKEISVSEQYVETGVSLASLSHETSQSNDVFLSGHLALLVDLQTRSKVKKMFLSDPLGNKSRFDRLNG